MSDQVAYCKTWFRAKKRPLETLTLSQAREAHQGAAPYTALIGSPDQPLCFVEITPQFAGVGFLDDRLRESLTYHFQRVGPDLMFLSMATYREFEGETDKVREGTTYVFDRSGQVKIRRERFIPQHTIESTEARTDVSANYSPAPTFGEYGDLVRKERL